MSDKYELIPNAKMLLNSLRSVGYTEETAIADIVDNSIAARADKIELYFDWDRETILIADNGLGMDKETLLTSMKIGSSDPGKSRDEKDLGRFGMGMKTAAFSIAKKLTVITKQNNVYSNATWDLDYVCKHDKWEVLIGDDNDIDEKINLFYEEINFKEWEQGTLIILSNLDKMIDYENLKKSKTNFYKSIKKIKKHLAMIFHRFIEEENIKILVNKNELKGWNPFCLESPSTMELAGEELYDGKSRVLIEPFILPHKNKFKDEEEYKKAGGVKDWLNQQGFYVYRNKRLIVYGTWFGKFKKEPAFNLARIKLDMNSESDFEWGIDIKKSKAKLPVSIEEGVIDIAERTIQKSVSVYNSRGTYNKKKSNNTTSLKYVWEQKKNSSGKYMFYINKRHPMLLAILEDLEIEKKEQLETYLSLLENYSPAVLSCVVDNVVDYSDISKEIKEKDLLIIKEKIRILENLNYEREEIIEVLLESAEYSYLKEEIRNILEEV